MKPRVFSAYSRETGEFSGLVVTVEPDSLHACIPAGMLAIEGRHDRDRFAVGHADDGFGNTVPVVVRRLPPRPQDTDFVAWSWCEQAGQWASAPTLTGVRAMQWERIKAARDAAISAPNIVVGGRDWQVSPASLAAIRTQLDVSDAVGPSWSTVWTFADNTRAAVRAADLRAVLLAVGLRANAAHQRAQTLRQAIDDAVSAAEINAINWPA